MISKETLNKTIQQQNKGNYFSKKQNFTLYPGDLSLENISYLLSHDVNLILPPSSYDKVNKSRKILEKSLRSGKVVYGINTGFGLLADKIIPSDDLKDLQKRIVLSHASGVGKPLENKVVKLILLLKINALAQGYSGMTKKTLDYLIEFYNNNVFPVIPEKGSVGASGDLAPLAHLALPLIGEGFVHYKDRVIPSSLALNKLGLDQAVLQEKEGLALLNGTQVSTAISIIGLLESMRNYSIATLSGCFSVDASLGSIKPFHHKKTPIF